MSTEAKHGPHPKFRHKLGKGKFSALIEASYTTTDGWAAGGVKRHSYASKRRIKRRNELLALRSCFLDWWMHEWNKQGGTYMSAVLQLRGYPIRPERFRRRKGLTDYEPHTLWEIVCMAWTTWRYQWRGR